MATSAAQKAQKRKLSQEFFCKFLHRELAVSACMDHYVNANALNIKNSPCFKCAHGLKTRLEFAAT